MKLLVCHNYYQQPGGEDRVFADELALLRAHGHEVESFTVHNDDLRGRTGLGLAGDTVWNRRLAGELRRRVERDGVELVHFHNTFPQISPAAYHAVRAGGAAVVQTLHNFRLVCPGATLFRDGQMCESCVGKAVAWPGIKHRCYRGSLGASAATAAMVAVHRLFGTWHSAVDRYIALTQFARDKFITGGLPAEKIAVKSNFIVDPPPPGDGQGGFALFVGRLSPEKGIETLLKAWRLDPGLPLVIAGDGPLAPLVKEASRDLPLVRWLGRVGPEEVDHQMARAALLVIPSECAEGFPKTLLEAFVRGTPVVAARAGSLSELVEDGQTGRLYAPGRPDQLAAVVRDLVAAPENLALMRSAARAAFDEQYTADHNYQQLIDIYAKALATRGVQHPSHAPQLA